MQRNITLLSSTLYDRMVVGGGIYGACAAWEGALRGLNWALIEAGDLGGAKETGAQVDEAAHKLEAFRGPLVCDLEPAAA